MRTLDVVFGRMPVDMDESEFDALPKNEFDLTEDDVKNAELFAGQSLGIARALQPPRPPPPEWRAIRGPLKSVMGVALGLADESMLQEVRDLLLDQGENEITDEPPDYERAHGSVHRGAAYLQSITYPPWGSSSGPVFGLRAFKARRAVRRR